MIKKKVGVGPMKVGIPLPTPPSEIPTTPLKYINKHEIRGIYILTPTPVNKHSIIYKYQRPK